MRLVGCIACASVAIDCAQKAVGAQPQQLFSTDALWVWWVFAVLWMASAVRFLTAEAI